MFGHKAIFDRVGSPNIPLLDDRENLNLELFHRGSVMTTQDVFFSADFKYDIVCVIQKDNSTLR